MKRRALLTWLGGLPVHAAAQKRGSDAPRPVDLMPDFWSAYDQSYGSSLDRASALRRGFLEKHAETYAKAGLAIPELPVLQKWLGDIAPLVSLMRVIHLRFPLAHDSAMKSFTG